MSLNRQKVAIGLIAALMHHAGWTQPTATASLLEQGRYWQNQGNNERATQAWEKLLLADPQQQEALYGLGLAAVREKRMGDANEYLARLSALDASGKYAQRLKQDITVNGPANEAIDQARVLAASGEPTKAVELVDQALQGREPQGDLALDYYAWLGYSPSGLPRAIQGLKGLLKDNPADAKIELALAKHELRDEGSRPDGLTRLARLSQRQDIGADATDSWRNGLLWMGADAAENKPLFEAYLAKHPDDQAVRTALDNAAPPVGSTYQASAPAAWRQDPRLARGYATLKQGDLAAAEAAFQAKLQVTPNDADALGGLGVVRLQQNKLAEAQELLSKAASRPGAGPNWRRALASARYWSLLEQAENARSAGDSVAAKTLIEQAIRADSRAPAAHNALARVLVSNGDLPAAEKQYRKVLSQHRNDSEALRGLIDLLAHTDRINEAHALVEDLPQAQRDALGDLSRIRASALALDARNAEKRGDRTAARELLERANAAEANNPWLTYELARLLSRNGGRTQAQSLMDSMLQARGDSVDANYAASLFATEQGDWGRAYDLLMKVPADRRNAEITALQERVWMHELIAQASRAAQLGDVDAARQQLSSLQVQAGDDPQLLGAIAQSYVDAGDNTQALNVMRPVVDVGQTPDPDALLPYVGVLLKMGEDARAARVLGQLQAMSLTTDQHRAFQDMVSLYTVRQSEIALARHDLVRAYDLLRPVLQRRPDDALAQTTLARMYVKAGDDARASDIYQSLQAREPDNAQLQVSIAGIANEANDWDAAEKALKQALLIAPNDPEVLAGAARVYRAHGRTGRAADLYQQAIAIEQERQDAMQSVALAQPATRSVNDNPFVGLPGQHLASAYNAANVLDLLDTSTDHSASALALAEPETEAALASPPAMARVAYAGDGNADAPPTSLRQELDEVLQERTPEVTAGVFVRSNNGEKGLSKITQVDAPIEVRLPAGDGKVALRVTPVTLNAGKIGDDVSRLSRFGGGPVATAAQQQNLTGGPGSQRDRGVGLSAGYETKGFKADIGVTPLGFEYSNLVGGVQFNGPIDSKAGTWYDFKLSRREVTDSLVSFAGAHDKRTGQRWGAVTANGASASIGADKDDYGIYAYGSLHKLMGHNVENNTRGEVGAGVYKNLVNQPDKKLTAGVNLGATFYDNNQRFFTYGHGGYFSPQQYYELSVPVTWAQNSGRFNYKLQASVGLRHFKEDDADYFPTNSGAQARAEAVAKAAGGSAVHKGQSRTGVGYNLSAAGEYKLNNQWSLGGQVGMDNASDYRQYGGGLYLRYTFHPVTRPPQVPLKPYQSPYMR